MRANPNPARPAASHLVTLPTLYYRSFKLDCKYWPTKRAEVLLCTRTVVPFHRDIIATITVILFIPLYVHEDLFSMRFILLMIYRNNYVVGRASEASDIRLHRDNEQS